MSLAQSLHSAVSGLTASAKGAETVAANLANLRTQGFGRRSLALTAAAPAGGVQVVGVLRETNPVLLAERRLAQASSAGADSLLGFHKKVETMLGQPGQTGALADSLSALEAALASAAESPGSEARLQAVTDALGQLAQGFRSTSQAIQQARSDADLSIAKDVEALNEALAQVASLNRDITRMTAMGRDASGLIDQRQVLIDKVAEIIPLREVGKDGRAVALYTMGGATLLDGVPAIFTFIPSATIAPDSMALSGLQLNGRAISTAEGGVVGGGRLTANFLIRDRLGPEAQTALDAVARDVMTRLEGADATRLPGAAGLLTDAGAAFDPAAELGLAGRLAVNGLIDPAAGGDLWRLRAGLGAAGAGPAGDGALLDGLARALQAPRPTATGGFLPADRSASGLVGALLSRTSAQRLSAETSQTFALARRSALEQLEAVESVDSDQELQLLMQIETAYAANARVIQAVDEMLDTLLRI